MVEKGNEPNPSKSGPPAKGGPEEAFAQFRKKIIAEDGLTGSEVERLALKTTPRGKATDPRVPGVTGMLREVKSRKLSAKLISRPPDGLLSHVGPFRLEHIASGGMGDVYRGTVDLSLLEQVPPEIIDLENRLREENKKLVERMEREIGEKRRAIEDDKAKSHEEKIRLGTHLSRIESETRAKFSLPPETLDRLDKRELRHMIFRSLRNSARLKLGVGSFADMNDEFLSKFHVAVKVLKPDLAGHGALRERFAGGTA